MELPEQPRALASQTSTGSGAADILAGEAAAHKVNWREVGSPNGLHIVESLHFWPMPRQDALASGVALDLPAASQPGLLETQIEPTDASEQRAEGHGSALTSRPSATR